jgi:GAF domain-containing protein
MRGGRGAVMASAGIIAAIFGVDLLVSDRVVLVSLMISAPLLCALAASPLATRWIAGSAIVVSAVSLLLSRSPSSWRFWVPLVVVTMGSSFALVMASYRERLRLEARRLQILADVAEIANGGKRVPEMAQALCDLLVPRLVDMCVIDLIGGDGRIQRLAGALEGDPDLLQEFLARAPSPAGVWGSAARAVLPASTQHVEVIDDSVRRELAHDEEDFALLQRLAVESAVIVPLAGRESPVGALILGTRAPRAHINADDVQYAETLAGRVALALDNAVLSEELSTTEQQLEVILGTVDAGITVRDTHGRMVYANQAAADLLKLPDPDAVKAFPPGRLMERFDVYSEAGDPVDLAQLPGSRVLSGEVSPPPIVVRNVVRETGEERWLLNRATAVADTSGRTVMAVNLIDDVTETKRSEIAQRLLATAARELTESSDLERALQCIADAAVPEMSDWAGVDLLDPIGRICTVAIAHRDPEKVRLGWHLRSKWPVSPEDPDGMPAVIRTGEPQLIPDITDEMLVLGARDPEHLTVLRAVGLNSTMIVPIPLGTSILGTLSFVSSTSRRFDERDLDLARDLGRQVGVFISNAQLHAEQAHIAQTLQAGLIPASLPALEGWEVSSVYRAAGRANEVGGDFYDIVEFQGGWAAIIGDVVGKGAEAAALTALARHTLAAIIESTGDVAYGLTVLNRRLRQRRDDYNSMCTIAALQFTGEPEATVFSAGHPLPVLRRAGEVELVGRTSPILGFVDDIELTGTRVRIDPGDQLVLYTDGVLDAAGALERFGEQRLLDTVRSLSGAAGSDPAELIREAIDRFLEGDQNDDIAIMSLTRTRVTASAPAGSVR